MFHTKIKAYILEKYGVKDPTLYVAQIKRQYGLEIGKAKDTFRPILKENIKVALDEDVTDKVTALDKKIRRKQEDLLEAGNDEQKIEQIGDMITALREERQEILTEAALKKDMQERIDGMLAFLDEQVCEVTEYSEPLVRRLIEKVTIYNEKMDVEFKSGLKVEVDA